MPKRDMNRSSTKYGDSIADHDWSAPEQDEQTSDTRVKSIELQIWHETVPEPEDRYEIEMYEVTVTFDTDTGEPYVLYAIEYRWKGNYWRDITDWDWRDLPNGVRNEVADSLCVDSPDDLDAGARLVDEGGESRWEKIHKPRMEAMKDDGQ